MSEYKVPTRDYQFVLEELLEFDAHYQSLPGCEEASMDVVNAVLEELAKFCENVLAPLNRVGDEQGCTIKDGVVTTPEGFKEAYSQYVDAGWPSMAHEVEFGGQGLPESMGTLMNECVGTANWAWGMYPGLSHGAMRTIAEHGNDDQKAVYLPPLVAGTWRA